MVGRAASRASDAAHDLVRHGPSNIRAATVAAFASPPRILITSVAATIVFVAMLLFANTGYSSQLLGRSLLYLPRALHDSFFYLFPGNLFRVLLMVYAVVTGITVTTLVGQFRAGTLSVQGAGGTVPGLFAGGCAGCGAGLLTAFGAAGAITVLPFGGLSLMLLGVALMLYYLAVTGDPATCTVE